jgi:small subunit ribosomal protein S2
MAPFIYGERDSVHIIDLQQTAPLIHSALKVVYNTVKNNGRVLFVGTKVQAFELIKQYALMAGQYYVNHRWLGGTLTNFGTVSRSIKKLEQLEAILNDEEVSQGYTKKELLEFSKKAEKLERALGGIRQLGGKPDLVIVIDTNKEKLAVTEATKLGIPVIGILDTNSDPDNITYPVPGNDDAIRSIEFYCKSFAEAALQGLQEAMKDAGLDIGEFDPESFKQSKKMSRLKGNKKVFNNEPKDDKKFKGKFDNKKPFVKKQKPEEVEQQSQAVEQ